jgi:hypothetical protein
MTIGGSEGEWGGGLKGPPPSSWRLGALGVRSTTLTHTRRLELSHATLHRFKKEHRRQGQSQMA